MAIDPLAISSGIGQGEAQVFKPFQTDYYKFKYQEADKRRQESAKMMDIDTSKIWSRDIPYLAPELEKLRQYYKDNYAKILKGDPMTQVEMNRMAQDIKNIVKTSGEREKLWTEGVKLRQKNQDKYTDESWEEHLAYAKRAGDFSVPDYLKLKLNKQEAMDSLRSGVSAMDARLTSLREQMVGDTETIFKQEKADLDEIHRYAEEQYNGLIRDYGQKQVEEAFGSVDNYKKLAESWRKESTTVSQVKEGGGFGFGKQNNFGVDVNTRPMDMQSVISYKEDSDVLTAGKFNVTSQASVQLPSGFSGSILSGKNFMPLQPFKEGKEYSKEDAEKILRARDIGANKYNIASVQVVPVYKKGAKGEKTDVDLEGMMVEDDILNNLDKYPNLKDKIEFIDVAFIDPSGKTGVEGYVPREDVDNIFRTNSKTKKTWDKTISELEKVIQDLNNQYGLSASQSNNKGKVMGGSNPNLKASSQTLKMLGK